MIAIQNADGTLVQVIDGTPGSYGSVALSLVRQRQRRADIKFYVEEDEAVSRVGTMVLKKLPDNTFGEAEISISLHVDEQGILHVSADTGEGAPHRDSFDLSTTVPDARAAEKAKAAAARASEKAETIVYGRARKATRVENLDSDDAGDLGAARMHEGFAFAGMPDQVPVQRHVEVGDGRIPGLMTAAIVLFVLSAMELIAYFVIRFLRP